jgi:hypothetical protein
MDLPVRAMMELRCREKRRRLEAPVNDRRIQLVVMQSVALAPGMAGAGMHRGLFAHIVTFRACHDQKFVWQM